MDILCDSKFNLVSLILNMSVILHICRAGTMIFFIFRFILSQLFNIIQGSHQISVLCCLKMVPRGQKGETYNFKRFGLK